MKKVEKLNYKFDYLTGVRPTSDLTVANYLGAIKPILDLQKQGLNGVVFVADLHGLTDNEPSVIKKYILEVVADYIALGIDPKKTKIYLQSDIAGETTTLMTLLARHITVAELLRVPTLKDKLKGNSKPENANALLMLYPVLMAADILIQRTKKVPVGEDQIPHLEVTRRLADKFNKKYGNILPLPELLAIKALRILSLKGDGKMSKSNPSGAIFLTDDLQTVAQKIKTAETAFEGKMNDKLESHILIAKGLAKTEEEIKEINAVIKEHKLGKPVMKDFKQIFTKIIQNFIKEFQVKRAGIIKNPEAILSILEQGGKIAKDNAQETIKAVQEAMYR